MTLGLTLGRDNYVLNHDEQGLIIVILEQIFGPGKSKANCSKQSTCQPAVSKADLSVNLLRILLWYDFRRGFECQLAVFKAD